MMTFNEFKKACSELKDTCERCDYSFELGVADDKVPFFKVFARKERMMLSSVIFDSIPSGTSYFVSIDYIREVPYIYIYPIELSFKSCL